QPCRVENGDPRRSEGDVRETGEEGRARSRVRSFRLDRRLLLGSRRQWARSVLRATARSVEPGQAVFDSGPEGPVPGPLGRGVAGGGPGGRPSVAAARYDARRKPRTAAADLEASGLT